METFLQLIISELIKRGQARYRIKSKYYRIKIFLIDSDRSLASDFVYIIPKNEVAIKQLFAFICQYIKRRLVFEPGLITSNIIWFFSFPIDRLNC